MENLIKEKYLLNELRIEKNKDSTDGNVYMIFSNKGNLKKVPFEINYAFDRYSVLHFDITQHNLFYDEHSENKIGFIDFDDAKYGPSVYDVAIASANLFFSKRGGVDTDGLNNFLKFYYEGNETLKEKEIPFIKKIALAWIDYILEGNNFDSSTTESLYIKRRLIDENMRF